MWPGGAPGNSLPDAVVTLARCDGSATEQLVGPERGKFVLYLVICFQGWVLLAAPGQLNRSVARGENKTRRSRWFLLFRLGFR